MNTNLKVVLFILAIVAFYVWFANSIPQIESRPPAETRLSADISPEELAGAGQQIVTGDKGGCLTCHGIGQPGPRAPDLQGVGARASAQVPGQTTEEYLQKALLDPCAYLVAGYDCLMAGMGLDRRLTKAEQKAVVAFLQSLGGEITVQLTAADVAAASGDGGASGGPEFSGATGEELFAQAGCVACHTLAATGAAGKVGPDLSAVGALLAPDEIRQSILEPNAVIAQECPNPEGGSRPCTSPSSMPPNFGERFTAKQLETLVTYLASLK
jgi:mono/diheme cytochrome c family protein